MTKIQTMYLFDGTVGCKKRIKSVVHILDGYSLFLELQHFTNLNSDQHLLLQCSLATTAAK
jgi:hypothetical protein